MQEEEGDSLRPCARFAEGLECPAYLEQDMHITRT